MPDMNFSDEDALIEKLIELTPSEPKYEVGQDVWFLYMGFEINHFKIQQLFLNNSGEWEYDNVPESDLFTSRESLIESQIQYWQSLTPAQISCSEAIRKHHDFEDDDCQHKEIVTGPYPRSNPPRKCTVCGELYR
jgi:hypothetical protein